MNRFWYIFLSICTKKTACAYAVKRSVYGQIFFAMIEKVKSIDSFSTRVVNLLEHTYVNHKSCHSFL